jgi:hypothetical protein
MAATHASVRTWLLACPSSHPVPITRIVVAFRYGSDGEDDITLSSGAPKTPHSDFFRVSGRLSGSLEA